jgi:5-hydroxyisourate hydrolase
MSGISTHILDTSRGMPAAGVAVHLFHGQTLISSQATNNDGRVPAMLPPAFELVPGTYRLVFEVNGPFFPEVQITFQIQDASAHYHVPLLLSPYGYSTYRGS